ncbi:hypothetical protein [Vogesella sp. LIG4]|uniref:hypothetical protein n=1 Tax=Vogesella sp. LIG4 TaxID=1192162 RepID=UPI0008201A4D|nr:hypothetical protein [Vogesella sp. LIG4]SCK10515.1 hypothetical protein PSELUDRAFT_0797 [Vogesella sp. LIG4]
MPNSQFFFVGASVLSVMFSLDQAWPMLSFSLLVMFTGLWRADLEQIADMAPSTLALFLARTELPLLPLERFKGHDLLYYQAGYPVYRVLRAGGHEWELVKEPPRLELGGDYIRVYPGLLYRRRDR